MKQEIMPPITLKRANASHVKKSILTLATILALTGSGCANKAEDQAALARETLNKLASVESCRDLESIMSPSLYEKLGPCDERLRFDADDIQELKTSVESCVLEENFTKEGKQFAVEDDGGYSIAFRCMVPEEDGEDTGYTLLRRVGSSYQIVNMTP